MQLSTAQVFWVFTTILLSSKSFQVRLKFLMEGGSPDRKVKGESPYSRGHRFESQQQILDGHFIPLIWCKRPKEAGDGTFKTFVVVSNSSLNLIGRKTIYLKPTSKTYSFVTDLFSSLVIKTWRKKSLIKLSLSHLIRLISWLKKLVLILQVRMENTFFSLFHSNWRRKSNRLETKFANLKEENILQSSSRHNSQLMVPLTFGPVTTLGAEVFSTNR